MLNGLLRKVLWTSVYGLIWLNIFGLPYEGRPIFYWLNQSWEQNEWVSSAQEELSQLWSKTRATLGLKWEQIDQKSKEF